MQYLYMHDGKRTQGPAQSEKNTFHNMTRNRSNLSATSQKKLFDWQ